jgi:hypothetical protein
VNDRLTGKLINSLIFFLLFAEGLTSIRIASCQNVS